MPEYTVPAYSDAEKLDFLEGALAAVRVAEDKGDDWLRHLAPTTEETP